MVVLMIQNESVVCNRSKDGETAVAENNGLQDLDSSMNVVDEGVGCALSQIQTGALVNVEHRFMSRTLDICLIG